MTRDGRLAGLNDDELIGVLRAWRRLESWSSAGVLAAIAELARRRPADRTPPAPPGQFPAQVSEFLSDEVAAALTLTGPAAAVMSDVALDLAVRLPGTFRAQHAGLIDYPRARLIAESTRILTDEQARQVEAKILPAAGEQTTGRLRAALARAVIAVDPGSGGLGDLATRGLSLTITPLAQDSCDHRHEEPGYQPSRKLQHLITARAPTCTAPAAGAPPPAATWTTPPPTAKAAAPANATWPRCAATTIAVNNPAAGNSGNHSPASCTGPPPPAATTPSAPEPYP